MLPRTLEPEVMDSREEAVDYNAMDHSQVNRAFIDDFLAAASEYIIGGAFDAANVSLNTLDVGTGTALIPIELCSRGFPCRITAIDLATEMLAVARENVSAAGYVDQIWLERVDAKRLPYPDGLFNAVISNSIVHHIPQPKTVLAEMVRVLRPGGLLFVRDLLRPGDLETVQRLVALYAGDANVHQKQMFGDSLQAALTLEEMRALLTELHLPADWVQQTTDRHWTLAGRIGEAPERAE